MNARAKLVPLAACLLASLALTACNNTPQDQQRVREDTARTTATIKSDIKGAAEGIRDGLREKTPSANDQVDINKADKLQLETLPGINAGLADRIIAHRPYTDSADLTRKHVISSSEYDRIASRLTTSH